MTVPRCSIIIPVYNHASLTRQCLNTILRNPPLGGSFEIIVVDDASTDLTPELLRSHGDQIRVVTHTENSAFATGCNDGAAVASGDYLVFLNNDTIPQSGWLDALVRYAFDHPKAAVVGSKLLFPNGTIEHAGMVICQDLQPRHHYLGFPSDHPAVNKSRRYQIVAGACILVSREAFKEVGGFDTAFRNGFEDVDLCLRLGERGYEVHYCHESVLYHLEAVSEGRFGFEELNGRLYRSRWGNRVKPDDLQYFVEDGLLSIQYRALYPISLFVSPLLATVNERDRDRQVDQLLAERSRHVYELLKENIRLTMEQQKAEN